MSCSHRKIEATFPHILFSLRQSNPRLPLPGSSPNEAIPPLVASTPQNEATDPASTEDAPKRSQCPLHQ